MLAIFWAIISLVFNDDKLTWQDLIALVLDPGGFGGPGVHDIFRLIVSLCGLFLFSALLISINCNIFENIAESFRSGKTRYTHDGHVLILGCSHHVFSMLHALLNEDSPYLDEDIVILTNQDVEALKVRLFSLPFLDSDTMAKLRQRLSVYHGERDNEDDLSRKNLVKNAGVIYIIGEESEINSDAVSLRCCDKLKLLCKEAGRDIRCFLLLHDVSSMRMLNKLGENASGRLKIDVIDANEYLSERVLIPEHGSFPAIDYSISRDTDGRIIRSTGIQAGNRRPFLYSSPGYPCDYS